MSGIFSPIKSRSSHSLVKLPKPLIVWSSEGGGAGFLKVSSLSSRWQTQRRKDPDLTV